MTTKRAGTTAWALLTVSTVAQIETLEDQRQWAERTAIERGWRLVHTVKGVASGKAGPRVVVRDLLAQLRVLTPADRPAWVLMIRLDRVARGAIVETQLVVHELKELGVHVWTREDGELRIDSAMEQLMVAMKAAVSKQENEVKRDKAIATYAKRRAAGIPTSNQRPLGLRRGAGMLDEPDEPFAGVIRTMFRLRLENMGLGSIARELLKITPPFSYKNGRTVQIRWTVQRVRKALDQRAYIGTIVDEVTFERAARIRRSPAPVNKGTPWPLACAMKCACGRGITSTTWGNSPARIRYYVCRAIWNHGKLQIGHRATGVEAQFLAKLRELAARPRMVALYGRRARTVSTDLVRRALREAETALGELTRERKRVWALNAAGKLRDEDLQERLDAVAERRRELEERVAELRAQSAFAEYERARERDAGELIRQAAKRWARAKPLDQQKIARLVGAALGGLVLELDGTLSVRPV